MCFERNVNFLNMKYFLGSLFCCFIALNSFALTQFNEIGNEIANAIRSGNSKEVSKHFSSSVNLTLLNHEGMYSSVQAEIILRDFFNKNTPTEMKNIKSMDSNPTFRYYVLQLHTQSNQFRVSYKLVSDNNTFKISELRIEQVN